MNQPPPTNRERAPARPVPLAYPLREAGLAPAPELVARRERAEVASGSRWLERVGGVLAGTVPQALVVLLVATAFSLLSPTTGRAYGNEQFPCPTQLEPRVAFWVRIFTEFGKDQRVIHDTRYPWVIYEVMDVSGMAQPQIKIRVAHRKEHYASLLERMAKRSPDAFDETERRIALLLKDVPEADRYAFPRDRIRSQAGVRDQFLEGLRRSGRYRPAVESVLDSLGLPREIATLPHVESGYHPGAVSKAGAKGLWQFMPRTGKQFLRVERDLDERLDPIRATEAAAHYLLDAYATVGTWPLAVVSYNHGISGVMRAKSQVGCTDIDRILLEYDGPAFGFASQNFYCEFLAALAVSSEPARYFGAVHLDPPLECANFPLPAPVRWDWLLRAFSVNSEQLASLNPAVGRYYTVGRRPLPRGYILRLPIERAADAGKRWTVVPASARAEETPANDRYLVRPGDTLGAIARRHRVPLSSLLKSNQLGAGSVIKPGQRLTIPGLVDREL
jgi:membrane-bound lytic murein transglycosylase D